VVVAVAGILDQEQVKLVDQVAVAEIGTLAPRVALAEQPTNLVKTHLSHR
jgi:hypothetical protein